MLIYLDESIFTNLNNKNISSDLLEGLEDLASVMRAGTHLVIGGYNCLQYLAKLESLGLSARMAYRAAFNKFSQLNSALQHVSIYAKVTCNTSTIEAIELNEKRVINIPLSMIKNMNLKSPVEIIFEELNDASIFEIIARWYTSKLISPGFINRNYKPVHGGGGRTHVVYTEAQKRDNQFCLCITDSDKKFPNDTYGQTSTDVRVANKLEKALSYHLDLDFHEIENLVPLNFLKEKCTSRPSQEIITLLKQAEANGYPEAKLFWDYKKGLKLATLKSLEGSWEYWMTALGLNDAECTAACKDNGCKCEIIRPWPEKKIVKDNVSEHPEMDPSECIILSDLWKSIGTTLVSWSASSIPKAA